MKVWIIRHGQTDWNKNGKIQGSTDIELNETGIKQAEEVIPTFNEHNFDLIISSTLKRAMKTAQIINREKNVEIIYDKRLIERHCGDYEGTPTTLDEEPLFNILTNVSTHNIETVKDLFKTARPQGNYDVSIEVLKYIKENNFIIFKRRFL